MSCSFSLIDPNISRLHIFKPWTICTSKKIVFWMSPQSTSVSNSGYEHVPNDLNVNEISQAWVPAAAKESDTFIHWTWPITTYFLRKRLSEWCWKQPPTDYFSNPFSHLTYSSPYRSCSKVLFCPRERVEKCQRAGEDEVWKEGKITHIWDKRFFVPQIRGSLLSGLLVYLLCIRICSIYSSPIHFGVTEFLF